MTTFFKNLLCSCFLLLPAQSFSHTNTNAGLSLPDTLQDLTIEYYTVDNLIVLPVSINGQPEVNLILDTGCRNIVLFGKRFKKLLPLMPGRVIEFSGMGSGRNVQGGLSINNTVSLGAIKGENVPVVVVPSRSFFRDHAEIDGLIGYDIFTRFEVEINPSQHLITFRPIFNNHAPEGYVKMPLTVTDSKPLIASTIVLNNETIVSDLLIDTGSALGLLLKSSDKSKFGLHKGNDMIGKGLNGLLTGVKTTSKKLHLHSFDIADVGTSIIHSPWHDDASIGMDILKNYSIILNYTQAYVCFKRV